VENSKDYSTTGSFPIISFGYETLFNNSLNLGLELGFGSRNFSRVEFSSYDSTQNSTSLKENIFALYVYGRYYLLSNTSRIQPYIKAGLDITSSHIRSETKINFTYDNSETIVVTSGARATGVGVMAKVGAAYFISNQLQVNLDAGFGLSVINAGISFNIQ
jgi:outer membrane protein W